jgi:hypothetical protein
MGVVKVKHHVVVRLERRGVSRQKDIERGKINVQIICEYAAGNRE